MAGFAILGTTEPDFYRGSATGIPRNKNKDNDHNDDDNDDDDDDDDDDEDDEDDDDDDDDRPARWCGRGYRGYIYLSILQLDQMKGKLTAEYI